MKLTEPLTSTGVSLPFVVTAVAVPDHSITGPPFQAEKETPVNCDPRYAGLQHDACGRPVLSSLVSRFEDISLVGMEEENALLMSRMENKYIMTLAQCRNLVRALTGSFRVLEIKGKRIGRYTTVYYDTPAFVTYYAHHNGKKNRFKLRLRHYDSSGETFLEVKKKNNKGKTDKSRMKTAWTPGVFHPDQEEFLRSALPCDWTTFHPVVRTIYDRITLVAKDSPERITLDTGISFDDGRRTFMYPGVVIGEIKYEKSIRNSPALSNIHRMGIRRRGFSKYCTGASLLYERLKSNRFKENLLFLSRLDCRGGVPC